MLHSSIRHRLIFIQVFNNGADAHGRPVNALAPGEKFGYVCILFKFDIILILSISSAHLRGKLLWNNEQLVHVQCKFCM